jgi:uncharacterized protein (TIGR02600 family)
MKMLNQIRESLSGDRRQRGLALITVLSTLAILVVLTVATLSLSTMERRSSVKYADGENASTLADMAISLVMGQIWDGTRQERTNPTIWASQPGAIHKFSANGGLLSASKLYSDDKMVETSGQALATDTPASNWASDPTLWTDLNEPVIRPDSPNDSDQDLEVIFPIIDPRAFVPNLAGQQNSPNIEGFRYLNTFPGVKDATSATDINARLPMPVRWLYVLKDGTIGHLAEDGTFVPGPSGQTATEANPIVGRVAFWTDDETCKININTAGEPTPWSPPAVFHDRDYNWAIFPPTRYEYQRYPGHPATVAMSSVLFPNRDLDIYGKPAAAQQQLMQTKERIYEIMPKINKGGSMGGTVPFWALNDPRYSGARQFRADVSQSVQERLYASVDELLFSEDVNGNLRRTHDQSGSLRLFSDFTNEERALERVRFFLTAKSRAPETNMFGRPRVAIWPVADERLGEQFRTVYDRMIAYCSTINPQTKGSANSYFFRRYDSTSPTNDYAQIQRNQQLLEYLHRQMSEGFPSGGSAAASFTSKYGPDAAQILTQIFDYIRSTNVYDGILAPTRDEVLQVNGQYWLAGKTMPAIYQLRDQREAQRRTYTAARGSGDRKLTDSGTQVDQEQTPNTALPGHGQVVPIETSINGSVQRGFGRFPTVTEVGLQFICTADGNVDSGSWRIPQPDPNNPGNFELPPPPPSPDADPLVYSGGRTAGKIDIGVTLPLNGGQTQLEPADSYQAAHPRQKAVWYSNYPPFPPQGLYGTVPGVAVDNPRHYSNHPGYRPENWNTTLDQGKPLEPGQKRIQAAFNIELSAVATAFSGLYPDFCIEIEGLQNFRIGSGRAGFPVFNFGTRKVPWRSKNNLFKSDACREPGGSVGPSALAAGRHTRGVGRLPDDPGYNARISDGGMTYDGETNYEFTSTFTTVNSNEPLAFRSTGPLRINIYATRDMSPQNLVQTINIQFPNSLQLPTPDLVVLSSPRIQWQDSQGKLNTVQPSEAPRWWAFQSGGALGRFSGGVYPDSDPQPLPPRTDAVNRRTRGRLYTFGSEGGGNPPIPLANGIIYNGGNSVTQPWRRPRPVGMNTSSLSGGEARIGYITPDQDGPFGQDVIVSMVPRHGDFRLIAAKKVVPASDWVPHPDAGAGNPTGPEDPAKPFLGYNSHSYASYAEAEPGASHGSDANPNNQLVAGARYGGVRFMDLPDTSKEALPNASLAKRYGDFDTGLTSLRDGPWINRADEGNTGVDNVLIDSEVKRRPTAYFDENWRSADAGEAYMTPNRMMPSPVVFGSLPTGVNSNEPWRTLLFRPFVPPPNGSRAHPGSPNYGGSDPAFSGVNPADHYLLDLFWMPTVEPYAISEPFSTAGKINLNYQMVPFNTYIKRATGLHALMKGELFHALPSFDVQHVHHQPDASKTVVAGEGYGQYYQAAKWTDQPDRATNQFYTTPNNEPRLRFWHRKINMDQGQGGRGSATRIGGTLAQFEDRFEYNRTVPAGAQGIFRTASQICEVHLVPEKMAGSAPAKPVIAGQAPSPSDGSDANAGTPYEWQRMDQFWDPRAITGDNLRERPYAGIYGKVTTKSNTFRVHFRAQSIRKARSVAPDQFQVGVDTIASDYRGSALIERRIDPEDPRIPDYAANPTAESLENFYSFRVLERKRFNP